MTTGLTHVATVSFLASRAAPSLQFWLALGGGIALARAAAVRSAATGYGAAGAAMLQTVAVMGPARINAPLTQAITAPMMGRLQARGTPWALEFAACLGLRLLHYAALMAALVFVVLGGVDEYVTSYERLTGWLPLLPDGTAGALAVGALANVATAVFFSVVQVTVYRRALGRWPDGASAAPGASGPGRPAVPGRGAAAGPASPAATAESSREIAPASPAATAESSREIAPASPPRGTGASTLGRSWSRRSVASGLLLASTAWVLLAGVAAWLALAWSLSRGDRSAVPLGAALAATLAIGALVGGLLGGAGLELALRRAIRAALLVAVATWMRSAAGQEGLREVFRRGLHRLGRIPAAAEAARLLEGLDAGPRLVAAGRAAAGRLAAADLRPAPMADALAAWVAGEAAGYVAGGPPAAPALRTRHRDRVLVLVAAVPVLALIGA